MAIWVSPKMDLPQFKTTIEYFAMRYPGSRLLWHCHILDHEDNEMMRPYKVTL